MISAVPGVKFSRSRFRVNGSAQRYPSLYQFSGKCSTVLINPQTEKIERHKFHNAKLARSSADCFALLFLFQFLVKNTRDRYAIAAAIGISYRSLAKWANLFVVVVVVVFVIISKSLSLSLWLCIYRSNVIERKHNPISLSTSTHSLTQSMCIITQHTI